MKLDIEQTRSVVTHALKQVAAQRDRLNELDRGLGDGDHGTTIARGANAAIALLGTAPPGSVNEVFTSAGTAMMKSMGGASGVLFGTFFQGAKACPASPELDAGILAAFFEKGLESLKQKSKAAVGDKTMMDAVVPAVEAITQGAVNSQPLEAVLQQAADAAENGARSTKGMLPRFGRARTLGERAAAAQDPGATSVSFFLQGLCDGVRGL